MKSSLKTDIQKIWAFTSLLGLHPPQLPQLPCVPYLQAKQWGTVRTGCSLRAKKPGAVGNPGTSRAFTHGFHPSGADRSRQRQGLLMVSIDSPRWGKQ